MKHKYNTRCFEVVMVGREGFFGSDHKIITAAMVNLLSGSAQEIQHGLHGLLPAPPRPALPRPMGLAAVGRDCLPTKGLLWVQGGGCGLACFGTGCGAGYPHISVGRGGAVRRQLAG